MIINEWMDGGDDEVMGAMPAENTPYSVVERLPFHLHLLRNINQSQPQNPRLRTEYTLYTE